jgi:gas vesicle protein
VQAVHEEVAKQQALKAEIERLHPVWQQGKAVEEELKERREANRRELKRLEMEQEDEAHALEEMQSHVVSV